MDLKAIIAGKSVAVKYLKPIFHCDAKPFALGTGIGLDPQCHTFASPNAKGTNMLGFCVR